MTDSVFQVVVFSCCIRRVVICKVKLCQWGGGNTLMFDLPLSEGKARAMQKNTVREEHLQDFLQAQCSRRWKLVQ